MRNSSLSRLLLQKSTVRTFRGISEDIIITHGLGVSKWRAELKKDLAIKGPKPKERKTACIYRVPFNMREVQPNAYAPNIISIGPYHHGDKRLQEMEELKWEFFHRLFDPKRPESDMVKLDLVIDALGGLEQDARSCYWDEAEHHSKDNFVKMMLLDGCFILELFKELNNNNFHYAPSVKRWMLPVLRRDFIMLENQLPLFVLQKLFELTGGVKESTTSLEELALCFFNPLLQRESNSDMGSTDGKGMEERHHFLDLFRLTILPKEDTINTAEEGSKEKETDDMIPSMAELMEAGVIVEKSVNRPQLDVRCEKRWLQIPPLYIDDYKGTLFRNMVAYEQCHPNCKPDVTLYLFFFDGLINSAYDVELLHHKGVLHHCLGSNKEVAKLVNGLCKEIARDARESYLKKVVTDVNSYYSSSYARFRARLVHHYFRNWVIGISTCGATIVLYLTLLQTGYGFVGNPEKLHEKPFHHYLADCLFLPVNHLFSFKKKQRKSRSELKDEYFEIGQHWMISI